MNKLVKILVGAAIAGGVIGLLRAQLAKARAREDEAFDDRVGVGGSLEREPARATSTTAATEAPPAEPSIH